MNNPVKNIDPDGRDWRISTHYNDETKKIEYQMTVNAVLYNNSSNPNIDMNQLATSITQQINSVYNISERTAAHELGHTGGLHDLTKIEDGNDRLMMQAIKVDNFRGIPDKALRLPQSSIMEIRNNYINNKLNHDSPVKTWFGKKYLSR